MLSLRQSPIMPSMKSLMRFQVVWLELASSISEAILVSASRLYR